MSFLPDRPVDEKEFPTLATMRKDYGFIPNFFRAQTTRPDLIDAEAVLIDSILLKEGALSRTQREYVFLVCSAANLSTYCVTAHCEIVRAMGISGPKPEQIAIDYIHTDIAPRDKALLNFASKLNRQPAKTTKRDVDALRPYGFGDQAILETILLVGLAKFANLVASGLGTVPDFEPVDVEALLAKAAGEG